MAASGRSMGSLDATRIASRFIGSPLCGDAAGPLTQSQLCPGKGEEAAGSGDDYAGSRRDPSGERRGYGSNQAGGQLTGRPALGRDLYITLGLLAVHVCLSL